MNHNILRFLIFAILFTMIIQLQTGCEPKGPSTRVTAPPLKQTDDSSEKTVTKYSYKHKPLITQDDRNQMRDIYVLAVARVADTGLIDQSPFGDKEPIGNAAGTDIEIKTEVKDDADITITSKQEQKLKPEKTPAGFSISARNQIISNLQLKRCFTIIERESINDIMREIEFGQSKWADKNNSAAIGNLQGVHYIVKGGIEINSQALISEPVNSDNWVGHVGFPQDGRNDLPFIFRLRMYHVETGIIVAIGDGYGNTTNEAIKNAVDAMTSLCIRDYRENYQ